MNYLILFTTHNCFSALGSRGSPTRIRGFPPAIYSSCLTLEVKSTTFDLILLWEERWRGWRGRHIYCLPLKLILFTFWLLNFLCVYCFGYFGEHFLMSYTVHGVTSNIFCLIIPLKMMFWWSSMYLWTVNYRQWVSYTDDDVIGASS